MENFKFFGGRVGHFCIFLGFFLLIQFAHAGENETEPTENVNLGPIQKWRSAFFCLKHKATDKPCAGKGANLGVLTPQGKLNVKQEDMDDYCGHGQCAEHIMMQVLKCIRLVHRDFVFNNSATIDDVNNTIATSCADKSKGLFIDKFPKKSSGIKVDQKTYVSVASAFLVFAAIFNM